MRRTAPATVHSRGAPLVGGSLRHPRPPLGCLRPNGACHASRQISTFRESRRILDDRIDDHGRDHRDPRDGRAAELQRIHHAQQADRCARELGDLRVQMEKYFQDNRTYLAGAACGIAVNAMADANADAGRIFDYTCPGRPRRPTRSGHGRAAKGMTGFVFTVTEANVRTSVGPGRTGPAGVRLLVRAQGRGTARDGASVLRGFSLIELMIGALDRRGPPPARGAQLRDLDRGRPDPQRHGVHRRRNALRACRGHQAQRAGRRSSSIRPRRPEAGGW